MTLDMVFFLRHVGPGSLINYVRSTHIFVPIRVHVKTVWHIYIKNIKVTCLCSQADIFSYGVILWEIVTHEQPTRGGLRDCRVPQECPAEIDSLITRCLHQDADEGPCAKEICEIIQQWRVGREGAMREAQRGKQEQAPADLQQRTEQSGATPGDGMHS